MNYHELALLQAPAPARLLSLSLVDIFIILIYFVTVLGIGVYLKRFTKTGKDFFLAGREMTAWVAGIAGLGGQRVSVRHHGSTLVLGGRDSGNDFSGHRNDAVLLHLQNALGSGVFEAAVWLRGERTERGHLRLHDDFDVGREHVRDGRGDGGSAGVEPALQHDCFDADGRSVRSGGRAFLSDF